MSEKYVPDPTVPAETVEWEVWRQHFRGGQDVRVCEPTDEESARELLEQARLFEDNDLSIIGFYLVKVTAKREVVV